MKRDVVLNVYKPKGISSFKCVSEVRKRTGVKKAGHAGTLDPEAEGVLPVLLGKATRLNEFFLKCDKSYRCEILFGRETDTCDIWGKSVRECGTGHITEEKLLKVLENYTGEQRQIPPVYSAIKKDGIPMYKLARKGENPLIAPRTINIYSIELLNFSGENAAFNVNCSKGTYIRSLCRDIGISLQSCACMSGLVRTAYGPYKVENAVSLEDINEDIDKIGYPLDCMLSEYPARVLIQSQKEDYMNGKKVLVEGNTESEYIRLYYMGELFALAKVFNTDNSTLLVPWKYFGE